MKSPDHSLKYKLRLVWAYKDVVRSHVPVVSRWYVRSFRRSQVAAARRLRGKERLEVAFFLTTPGMWKCDYVFRAMEGDPRFHPYVVIYPYSVYKGFSRGEVDEMLERTRRFVESKGFEYVIPYDGKCGRWLDVKRTLDPDIVFFSSPYKDHLPQFFVYHFRDRLTCYVPYGFSSLKMYKVTYDLLFDNLVGLHFLETEMHRELAARYARNGGENVVVTGYPGTEVFLREDYHPTYRWKPQVWEKRRVIWAPHHTVDDTIEGSTFLAVCDEMLEVAEEFKEEVQFVFKPHQLLKLKLLELWGRERTEEYYERWASGENTQLEESSYVDLFLTSDAMIHDSGSFTTEYLFTGKPVMYLTDEGIARERFGPFGMEAFECHYHGKGRVEVERFLRDVVVGGKDPMSEVRRAFFERYLQPIGGKMPSERIIYEIEKLINS